MRPLIILLILLAASKLLAQRSTKPSALGIDVLQKEVFSPRCGISACHDGSFEPDFRTSENSYNTLVYHPVIKNNSLNQFKYRVEPGKPENSVLFERLTNCCFVNQNDRMPFTVGDSLPGPLIDKVKAWILNGAPDRYSKSRTVPPPPIYFSEKYYVRGNDSINLNGEEFHQDKMYPKPLFPSKEIEELTFAFVVQNSEQPDSSLYSVAIFYDHAYSKPIKSFALVNDKNTLTATIKQKEFIKGTPCFLQLTIKRKDRTYHYPNTFTPYYQKLHWSVLFD